MARQQRNWYLSVAYQVPGQVLKRRKVKVHASSRERAIEAVKQEIQQSYPGQEITYPKNSVKDW